jgi:type II secretory pathway component PulM
MTPAATEAGRSDQLQGMVRQMYRDMSINLNNCQAANDWVQMTLAEVSREKVLVKKENARAGAQAHGLRNRLRNLVIAILPYQS